MTRERLSILATGLDLPIRTLGAERKITMRELQPKIREHQPQKRKFTLPYVAPANGKALYEKRRRTHFTKIRNQELFKEALARL